jgi:8-oxo-dGTP diphosphatase
MIKPPEIKKKTSSGGVIFNVSGDIIEVALVCVSGRTWCLHKGIIDKGEDPPATALREVREETGLTGEIVDKIGQISYWYYLKGKRSRIHKTVHLYLLKFIRGSTNDHDHEVDEAKWFPIDEALKRLSYKSEKGIMLKAKAMIMDTQLK